MAFSYSGLDPAFKTALGARKTAAPTPAPYPTYAAPSGPSPNPTNTPDAGSSVSGFGAPAVGNQYAPSLSAPATPEYLAQNSASVSTPEPKFPDFNVWMQKALEQYGVGGMDSDLRALRERAIIDWGDPALAQLAGFGLDPQAGTFAKQNYLSGNAMMSRLDKKHDLDRKAVINRLASRGLLRSGDLGYGLGEADAAYGNDQYDARQRVLAQLESYMQNYIDRKNALRQNVQQAYETARNNFLSNPSAYLGIYDG